MLSWIVYKLQVTNLRKFKFGFQLTTNIRSSVQFTLTVSVFETVDFASLRQELKLCKCLHLQVQIMTPGMTTCSWPYYTFKELGWCANELSRWTMVKFIKDVLKQTMCLDIQMQTMTKFGLHWFPPLGTINSLRSIEQSAVDVTNQNA